MYTHAHIVAHNSDHTRGNDARFIGSVATCMGSMFSKGFTPNELPDLSGKVVVVTGGK